MTDQDQRVCLKKMRVVDGKPQYCGSPAWIEPGRTNYYYIYEPRHGMEDRKVNLCQAHALEDAEKRYATMWEEVQALEQDPGLDISQDKSNFLRAASVLAQKPSRGLLMAANAKANALAAAARIYFEYGQNLIVRYSGVGMEDLQSREHRVRELLEQFDAVGFRISNTPRDEYRPYREMHELATAVREEALRFYRNAVSFPERQKRLLGEQARREAERKAREEEASRQAEQRNLVESTRARLVALLDSPSAVPAEASEPQPKAKAPKRGKASRPPEPSPNGRTTAQAQSVGEATAEAPA